VRVVESVVSDSPFVQLEAGRDGLWLPWVQTARANGEILRADIGQDNKPTLADQQAIVQAGLSLIQNDHPWNAWDSHAPLRPGVPIRPELMASPDALNEPGNRVLFRKASSSSGVAVASADLGTGTSSRWETAVSNTRPATNGDFPNPHWPRGKGCIYAQSTDARDAVRVCRTTADGHWNVSKPLGEDVIVTVEVTHDGSTTTSTSYSNARDTLGAGELLRLDVAQTPIRACVTAYSSERIGTRAPQWIKLQTACLPAQLWDQGLSAENGDVLFVGTKLGATLGPSPPASADAFFEPNNLEMSGYRIQNLTWPR
jgi:hypothetical protein